MILYLAGAATLLIWAVRMVRTGVERAYGAALRRFLRYAAGRPVQAAGIGAMIAVLLQSSTAVAVLAAGFAASGLLTITTGFALMLGADVGSALVVQILSLDLSWLMPVLLIIGGFLFLKGVSRPVKQGGRIMLGIALILVSLEMIGTTTAPLRDSDFLAPVVRYLSGDYITAFLIGALFTWLIHSSVASIILIVTFAAQGLVPIELGVSLTLGANLGGALISVGLTRGAVPEARQLPLGNLIFRGTGAVLALVIVHGFSVSISGLGDTAMRQIVNLHLLFNIVLVVVALPLIRPVAILVEKLTQLATVGPLENPYENRKTALDRNSLDSPRLALTCATREILRMGETIEVMLRPVMDLYESGDKERIKHLRAMDQEVNAMHLQIKLYLSELSRGVMSADEASRSMELTNFVFNLEAAGDIISKSLLKLADDKRKQQLSFSPEGWRELTNMHDRVLANMQLALNVLVSGDHDSARQLVEEKELMGKMERQAHDSHIQRLQTGTSRSLATSDIHVETARALKQINSLFASAAYPILAQNGDLLGSRLAKAD